MPDHTESDGGRMQNLIQEAIQARKMAYAPYSHFQVGAALQCADGTVYRGCNIENAAYSPGNCAERTAFFKAVSEGKREFVAIAIVGGSDQLPADGPFPEFSPPCGVCRQVMMEFVKYDTFRILLAKSETEYVQYTLKQLLPMGFGPANL